MPLKIKTKQTGRVQKARLDGGQLTAIGTTMVEEQRRRWMKGIDADGQPAKKLTVAYAIWKQKLIHMRPKRDNRLTGLLFYNFTLRKAIDGTIRAEATSREARQHAKRAESYDQMTGFSGTDLTAVFTATQKQYGQWLKKAWVPIRG